jgi:hypothetical protein
MKTITFAAVTLVVLLASICEAASVQRRWRWPWEDGCQHFYSNAPWAIKFYSRPNCHNKIEDDKGNEHSFRYPAGRPSGATCSAIKKPARSFHMVGREGCAVHVYSNGRCQGESAYSTAEGHKDTGISTPSTTIRWWTEKDLGTNKKKWIRSFKVKCPGD